eukprot:526286-Pyramimonas_sp.AAC.2
MLCECYECYECYSVGRKYLARPAPIYYVRSIPIPLPLRCIIAPIGSGDFGSSFISTVGKEGPALGS